MHFSLHGVTTQVKLLSFHCRQHHVLQTLQLHLTFNSNAITNKGNPQQMCYREILCFADRASW
jgi:hypothetical protein